MYKLNIDHVNEVKYENTSQHGLFSGTIETDRVVLVDGDGKYLQVDGKFGTNLKNGLVRTYSATRDSAETAYKIATTNATTTAAVYCYADVMKLQSAYADVDAFIEYLVDELHLITIDDYENPKYELKAATIKTAGTGYTKASVDVSVPGEAGDTAGVVTCTIKSGAISAVAIKSAGSYEKMVATQTLSVTGGTGKITVTMQEISEGEAKGPTRSAPVEDDKSESEPKEELEVPEIKEDEAETKSEVEQEVEQEAEQPVEEPDKK